jgi:hypothetical protein
LEVFHEISEQALRIVDFLATSINFVQRGGRKCLRIGSKFDYSSVRRIFWVSIVSLPPSGIASRAFRARFRMHCCSRPGAAFILPNFLSSRVTMWIFTNQSTQHGFRLGHNSI